jgi:hypothetical protein
MLRPMTTPADDALRYPIGSFKASSVSVPADRPSIIQAIADAPAQLRAAVAALTDAQLDTPYRPGGWTVRQVAHHLPDSHANAYIRLKMALTEDEPTIKPYDEARWAELPDSRAPIDSSLAMLEAVHDRWVRVLRAMAPAEWARRFRHPERGVMSIEEQLALYGWHGRHHVAHITRLRERNGW